MSWVWGGCQAISWSLSAAAAVAAGPQKQSERPGREGAGCRRPDGRRGVVEDLRRKRGGGTAGGSWRASEAGKRGGYSRIVGRVEGGQWERRPCWVAFL